ncbi:hypothetical protein BpHYR1_003163 [Brachionus plicatilis]|uniref:Uncharacterized protein n=1 Tax=Brachionus plicatilis TaxID=10195 RepID=A0A3M7SKX0_BRAPC|nr:hypothetical protein BpHYR1_003163 [Brachionus plicatilis]
MDTLKFRIKNIRSKNDALQKLCNFARKYTPLKISILKRNLRLSLKHGSGSPDHRIRDIKHGFFFRIFNA